MTDGKSQISRAETYQEMGEFWDTYSLDEHWDQTQPAAFEIDTPTSTVYYPVDVQLSERLRTSAARHGVSPETLLNLWLLEKIVLEAGS